MSASPAIDNSSQQPRSISSAFGPRGRRAGSALAIVAAVLGLLAGCSSSSQAQEPLANESSVEAATGVELYDNSVVHTISVEFDQDDYDDMIDTFTSTGDKEWISATVTIDGVTHNDVGLRLKGNSSLFDLTAATSGNPEELPWLIRIDKFVDGADHQGYEDIVIRSNSTETAMNEAVAQELLALSGLAAQQPIAAAFTVNGGQTELRLAVENPDGEWYDDNFADPDGLLYKAQSDGDYSYRGDDPDAYVDVFEQKVGDDDLAPLTEFLDFINNADDTTFASQIGDRLDLDAFATYLAFQDLIGNEDDINGRGNNSYLQYDTTNRQFTVVSWDLNLAFNTANVGGGGRPERPGGAGGPGGVGGPGSQPNVLVDRLLANNDFASLYAAKTAELRDLLFTSGTVDTVIERWTAVLTTGAAELVTSQAVATDAAALIDYVDENR